jgi:hypothetical protein
MGEYEVKLPAELTDLESRQDVSYRQQKVKS